MSTKQTKTFKAFQNKHNLSYSNFFTFTNPKVLKNEKVSEIPTAILMLMNTPKACPSAGSCRSVCLITSGNPIYLDNKIKCRIRRNNAFMSDYSIFLRYLVVNCFRHYAKNRTALKVGFRLNGVSDYAWEDFSVKLTAEDTDYIKKAFNIFIEPIRYGSVIEAVQKAIDLNDNKLIKNSVQFYDYSKRIDRDFKKIKALNYHITLSHGSKFDTFSKALELGLNYAAAFNLKKSQDLPKQFTYKGIKLNVIDGDITDARFTDDNKTTNIVGLHFKIVANKEDAEKLKFCIDTKSVNTVNGNKFYYHAKS